MHSPKRFLINYCYAHGRFTHAVSMPFVADRYEAASDELFIAKDHIKEFYKALPPHLNNPKEHFFLKEENDFLILKPREVLTRFVTVTSNLYATVVINENNPVLIPADMITSPIYILEDAAYFPVYIEAQPTQEVTIADKTYMGYHVKLNGVDIYADNIHCIALTNPIYTVETLDTSNLFLVRILENGKDFKDAVARHTILKTQKSKIGLIKVYSQIDYEKEGFTFHR